MSLTVTQAGLNKAINASLSGISLKITHVALGSSGYNPTTTRTSLSTEIERVPVSGAANASGNQIHLTAVFDSNQQYIAREVGFFLEDGTLFAVDSHPSDILVYKSSNSVVIEAFDLILDVVPPNSITVNTTGDLSLIYSTEFVQFSTAIMDNMRRQIEHRDAINSLAEQLNLTKPLKG